jgi:cytochrome c biogenesis protein
MTDTTTSPPPAPAGDPGPSQRALPPIPGPLDTAKRAWRILRRMSTALWLLLALAIATIIATFIPQEPVIPSTVAEWRAGVTGPGEGVAAAFDALSLFDVFGAPWFMGLTALLLISLTGCLVPRIRGFWRLTRRAPAGGRNLDRLQHTVEVRTDLPPDEALATARRLLRRRRFRVRDLARPDSPTGNAQLAAEKGHWREGGSILFHLSFYVLLLGAVIGHSFGFVGQVNVVEGAAFADTRLSYLGAAQPGRWFPDDGHRGFTVALDDFTVDYFPDPEAEAIAEAEGRPTGLTPRDFVSTVTIREDGEPVATEQIRVNHPIEHDGMKLYQIRFGFAPRIEVANASGAVLYTDAVQLIEEGPFVWTGVAKVAAFDVENQIALELVLLPDAGFGADGMPMSRTPEARNPRLAAVLWYGELGLDRNIPPREFDRESGRRLAQPLILEPGETGEFDDIGLTVSFPELPFWSGFQVSHEPGRELLLAGSALMLAGLLPSLYAYRRRVWVDARADGDGTTLTLAGVALQRKQTFGEAFDSLADDLRSEVGDTAAPPRQEP